MSTNPDPLTYWGRRMFAAPYGSPEFHKAERNYQAAMAQAHAPTRYSYRIRPRLLRILIRLRLIAPPSAKVTIPRVTYNGWTTCSHDHGNW